MPNSKRVNDVSERLSTMSPVCSPGGIEGVGGVIAGLDMELFLHYSPGSHPIPCWPIRT